MVVFHLLLVLYWSLFGLLHSVLASLRLKAFLQRVTGPYFRYYRLLYTCLAFAMLTFILIFQLGHRSILLLSSPVLYFLGIPLALIGAYIMGVCIKKYFANLSGVDVFTKKEQPMVLEIGGLHRYMRHPLYAGTLLFMWSLFLLFPYLSNLIACVVSTTYVLIGISIEERKLVMEYGDRYKVYASRTPKLIPFLRRSIT
ncbi:MAG: isoprenylcysteine carboxylmethyltransferase family protein [Williamsia sp.]|nr:isoprenylcysteine carboxylmethyltransferase family protein [Williamsia sp.]